MWDEVKSEKQHRLNSCHLSSLKNNNSCFFLGDLMFGVLIYLFSAPMF